MKIDNRDVFEQIGNVFYAIAAEQHVKPLEVAELKSVITNDWLPRNLNDSMISDEAHGILIAMDTAEANNITAKEAFTDFVRFYKMHPDAFRVEVQKRMMDTAVKITKIFEADNPNQNSQLIALKKLLEVSQVNA